MTHRRNEVPTMLKEMIERKFEFDKDASETWATNYRHANGEKGLPPYYKLAEWQHNQLKSEVLPILLECVSALEFYVPQNGEWSTGLNEIDSKNNYKPLGTKAKEALERLRKWSES